MTGWDWFWAAAVFVDVALIFGVLLLWVLERAHRRLWERRARKARGEVIDLTGMRPGFGNEPAGKVGVRERQR
jgi:hypothetical protein